MGLNTLGLGIILSLRDGASVPANRAAASLGQLDAAAQRFSRSFNSAMATAFEGMNMVATGMMAAAAPLAFIKSTLKTQKALAYVASSGVEDIGRMKDAAEDFTNYWAGSTQESFLNTAYEIKSGLYELSDAMVAKMTKTTGILAKATKSTVDEMQSLIPIMWGILRPSRGGITDEAFMNELAGALSHSVKIYRATGKYMGDAFSQATAIATQQGVSMEEQFAVLGRLQQTMTGSEAGTKLRALAVNTPRAVELAKKHDIDIQLTDTKGMILPLIDIIDNVRKKYGEKLTASAMEELRKVFGSREATSTIINLLPYVDKLREDTAGIRQAMSEGMPVAMDMATKAANNMSDAWEIFAQRVENTKQAIGEAIIPVFRPVMDIIGKIFIGIQAFAKASPWVFRLISAFIMLTSTLLIFTGALYIMSAAMKLINASLFLMKARLSLLKAEFMKLMITLWPFLLMAGLMYLAFKTNFMGINDGVMNTLKRLKELWDKVKLVWNGLMELIRTFKDDKGMISEDLKNQLEDAGLWELTKKLFMIYTRLRYLWSGIKEGFKDFWETLVTILKPIGEFLKEWVLKPLAKLLEKFGIVLPVLNKLIAPTQENANTWKEVGYWIGVAAGALMTFGLVAKLIKPVVSLFKMVWNVIKFFGGIVRVLGGIWRFLVGFGRVLMTVGRFLFSIGRIIWMVFMWVAGIVAAVLGIPVWLAALIVAAVVAIIVLIIVFRKQIWAFLTWLWSKIVEIFWICVDAVAGFFKWLWEGIKAGASAFWEFLKWVGQGIADGFMWVVDKVVGFFVWLWDQIKAGAVAWFNFNVWVLSQIINGFLWLVQQVVSFFVWLWDQIKAGATAFWNFLTWIGQQIAGGFKWVVDQILGFFTWVWEGIKTGASAFWDALKGLASGAFEGIKGIWNGITGVFTGIFDTVKSVAKAFFDWIAEKFKWVTDTIDKVKGGFNVVVDGAKNLGGGIKNVASNVRDSMPWNATGGIYQGPTVIGVGEVPGVKEAAIPLSGRHMMPFANAIASAMPEPVLDGPKTPSKTAPINTIINNNSYTTNVEQSSSKQQGAGGGSSESRTTTIVVPVKIGEREIAKAVASYVDQERRR